MEIENEALWFERGWNAAVREAKLNHDVSEPRFAEFLAEQRRALALDTKEGE